jgi:hypothetical protein
MPGCRRDESGPKKDEHWREPPGWLGDIVRRVKRLSHTHICEADGCEWHTVRSFDLCQQRT